MWHVLRLAAYLLVLFLARGYQRGQQQPRKHRDELEDLVGKRKTDLAKSNEQLQPGMAQHTAAEEWVEHLNLTLRAICNVNQLFTKEEDRDRLLQGACDNLVAARGYDSAWIALLDDSGDLRITAEAGLGDEFLPLAELLRCGELPPCGHIAMNQSDVVVIEDRSVTCTDCPLASKYAGRSGMAVRLEHEGTVYGLLAAPVPRETAGDTTECDLLHQVADHVASALHGIEQEEERKRSKRTVQKAREYAESIVATVREPLLVLDTDLRVVSANRSFCQTFQVTPDETENALVYDLGNRQWNIPRLRELLEEILPKNTTFDDFEVEHDFETIGRRTLLLNARQIHGEATKTHLILLAIEDITEHKRAEEELEQRRKYLDELAGEHTAELEKRSEGLQAEMGRRQQAEDRRTKESSAAGSILNDILRGELDNAAIEKRVLDSCLAATDSVYGMVGKINDQGNHDVTTYTSRVMEDCAFPEALAREMSTGMPIRGVWGWPLIHGQALVCNDLEAHPDRVGTPEGHVPIDCFLGAPLKRDGKVVGMIAVLNKPGGYTEDDKETLTRLASVVDLSRQHREALQEAGRTSRELERLVTERTEEFREAQEQLIRKEKLAVLGQLAQGVAHELRNYLGAIKNAAYYLNMAQEKSEPEVKETLGILKKAVGDSERIISSLLDFARDKPPVRRNVSLNDVVQAALSSIAVPENVEVVRQLDGALPTILADPDQLTQVFGNIVLNAVQAMAEGGRLTVKSEAPSQECVAVSFADTGVGIAEENLAKLFEPLFTTKAKGIGLGLPVAKDLVEGLGCALDVQSEPGKGSTFTVKLPVGMGEEK